MSKPCIGARNAIAKLLDEYKPQPQEQSWKSYKFSATTPIFQAWKIQHSTPGVEEILNIVRFFTFLLGSISKFDFYNVFASHGSPLCEGLKIIIVADILFQDQEWKSYSFSCNTFCFNEWIEAIDEEGTKIHEGIPIQQHIDYVIYLLFRISWKQIYGFFVSEGIFDPRMMQELSCIIG